MELKELTQEEIDLIMANRAKAELDWETEKTTSEKRARLRAEFQIIKPDGTKLEFEDFCKTRL